MVVSTVSATAPAPPAPALVSTMTQSIVTHHGGSQGSRWLPQNLIIRLPVSVSITTWQYTGEPLRGVGGGSVDGEIERNPRRELATDTATFHLSGESTMCQVQCVVAYSLPACPSPRRAWTMS